MRFSFPDDADATKSVQVDASRISLRISADQQFPCESGHVVTFSLSLPEAIVPLTLHFSYPVLIDEIDATFQSYDKSVQVVLKKALLEPWPCQFTDKSKWNVNQFDSWKEQGQGQLIAPGSQFLFHISAQIEPVIITESSILTPLQDVRKLISRIFFDNAEENVIIFAQNNPTKPLWSLRTHLPVLISPYGSPMLLLSAIDYRLADKLVARGKLQAKQFKEDARRFLQQKGNVVTYSIADEKTEALLRYMFRLNSTKISPTPWQEKSLPLGEFSPFLSTFLSPLYLDFPTLAHEVIAEEVEDQAQSFSEMLGAPFSKSLCARCGVQSNDTLKRCSKCKLVYYCTVDCQRADWKKHKVVCGLFK